MIHNYVTRPGLESHGSWSVNKNATYAKVLVQLTAGFDQTRVALPADEAQRLAACLVSAALVAMKGGSYQAGDRAWSWFIEVGLETAPGIEDEIQLHLHDAAGTNGDRRTCLAIPVADALNMVEDLSARSLQVARDLRADALSRLGRSPA